MNQVPSPQCPHCGRNLSIDDLRGQNCPSCGTALPHHARAAQQVALVGPPANAGVSPNQVMAQHMGAAANPYANPHANPHYMNAMHQAHAANAAAGKAMKTVFIVIGIIVALAILLTVGGAILAVVLSR